MHKHLLLFIVICMYILILYTLIVLNNNDKIMGWAKSGPRATVLPATQYIRTARGPPL